MAFSLLINGHRHPHAPRKPAAVELAQCPLLDVEGAYDGWPIGGLFPVSPSVLGVLLDCENEFQFVVFHFRSPLYSCVSDGYLPSSSRSKRRSRYRQTELYEVYYEKPEVTMERLLTLEQVMVDEIESLLELTK